MVVLDSRRRRRRTALGRVEGALRLRQVLVQLMIGQVSKLCEGMVRLEPRMHLLEHDEPRIRLFYALAQSVGELALTLEHVNDLIQVCHPGELLHVVKSVLEPLRRVTTLLLGPRFLLTGVDEPCFRRRMWCAGER